jgi:predicted amidohydrolase YtcJ
VSSLLVRRAEVDGRIVDVRVAGARIAAVAPRLAPTADEEVLDAEAGALLPGLHDAHLHLLSLAAAARSVVCGPPAITSRATLATALADAPADASGWVRGVGYVETVAGDLDASAVDALHPHRPVRIQHRSGALWMLNTAGAERLGLDDADHAGIERAPDSRPTGRLWRADAWLRTRVPPAGPPDLAAVGARLTALGVTSVCDATPDLDERALATLAQASASGALPQRLQLLGVPLQHGPLPAGLTRGPYKIVIADSALPDLAELSARIRRAHASGRPVAVHCVSREALVLLLVALESTGARPGDRVEHAAILAPELVPQLAHLGLRVVTQPGFLAHRGDDYLRDVPAPDVPDLYRCRSLLAAGVPLALSSDAPYGPLDPWAVMAAAVERRTASGAVVGSGEALTAAEALAGYLAAPDDPGGPSRRVRPGAAGDVVLLDRPLGRQLAEPTAAAVRTVVIGGRIAYRI